MLQKAGIAALASLLSLLFFAQPGFTQKNALENDAETALKQLKEETLSYFARVAGTITSVEGNSVKIEPGPQVSLKKGMRLTASKEGAEFYHPVTKEPLGNIDLPIGTVEVTSVAQNGATGVVIKGNPENFAGARLKIPATKIKVLFYQGDIDWFLGDAYYQVLRDTNRFELIDTGIETNDVSRVLADAKAKGAAAAIILHSETSAEIVDLKQDLFWVGDEKPFSQKMVSADKLSVKELRFKAGLFIPTEGEVLLTFHLPFKADRLAAGDLEGNGNPEILLAYGNKIRIYRPGVNLKATEVFTIPGGEIIWMDAIDLNKDGRDEILITAMQGDDVVSYIYEFQDSRFTQLLKIEDRFLRKLGNQAIAQAFSRREGYDGPVYFFTFADNKFRKGDILKLPAGVNIYDFQPFISPEGGQSIAAWDERGFLNVYNDKGIRLWMSKEDFGGLQITFSKESGLFASRGTWSVKDRLIVSNNELLAPKRKPLLGSISAIKVLGLGYGSTSIKGLWWNGAAIEERDFIKNAGGNLLDFDLIGDRMVILAKGSLTARALNILKGEDPFFSSNLYIYSLKGR
ncbi:MAG: VCBS repeat-containing protein [Nitrospirae bacterium]|nr:VCBS repeat-containing protein [Nitrospirota bacterium]